MVAYCRSLLSGRLWFRVVEWSAGVLGFGGMVAALFCGDGESAKSLAKSF